MKIFAIYRIETIFILILYLLLICFFPLNVWSKVSLQDQVDENTQQIQVIESKIVDLKDNYKLLYDGAKNQNDQISDQISFLNNFIAVVSVFVTVFGIFLAWYINNLLNEIKDAKSSVDKTKKFIDGHNDELLLKVQREGTMSLLKRLENVPEDILNLAPTLFSRELLTEDYLQLKKSYTNLYQKDPLYFSCKREFTSLFLQHFPYQSITDFDIKEDIINGIDLQSINSMHRRDFVSFSNQVSKNKDKIEDLDLEKIKNNLLASFKLSKFNQELKLRETIESL